MDGNNYGNVYPQPQQQPIATNNQPVQNVEKKKSKIWIIFIILVLIIASVVAYFLLRDNQGSIIGGSNSEKLIGLWSSNEIYFHNLAEDTWFPAPSGELKIQFLDNGKFCNSFDESNNCLLLGDYEVRDGSIYTNLPNIPAEQSSGNRFSYKFNGDKLELTGEVYNGQNWVGATKSVYVKIG